ncbi:MAG: K+/H+ antiporter subunit F [Pseudomonadota bacterium]
MLMTYALYITIGAVALTMVLCMYRLLRGPCMGDRVLSLDTISINAVSLIVLYGMVNKTQVFFEAALLIAMVGFISTVAFARFLLRRDVIE